MTQPPKLRRRKWKIQPDASHVICRLHLPGDATRIRRLTQRVLELSSTEANEVLEQVMLDFSERHRNIRDVFERHLKAIADYLPRDVVLSTTQRALIGAYFTMEYSVASAALFNPSIVLHPNQDGLSPNCLRFIMSLRAVGEGHISSIIFCSGIIDQHNTMLFDPIGHYVDTPRRRLNPTYDRHLFRLKLNEMSAANAITACVLNGLPEQFSYDELTHRLEDLSAQPQFPVVKIHETFEIIKWLANSNYELEFQPDHAISERVIFPTTENESGGIEDARFVQFYDDNGDNTYYATYTAYNGFKILPQLIETRDFVRFKVITLNGRAVQNKGMALFPRKINGKYVMLSRQDGENNHIMYSDHLHFWQYSCVIQQPDKPWEFVQIGNCGSPLETGAGWLVLTHGVGPMRQYCIGAMLLDLDDPCRIIARLEKPLLSPHEQEREGYVPNVVYTCGAILHNNELIIPYSTSDTSSGLASVDVADLIDCMRPVGT
ncbi:MAG: glycoside hydrolase family 130 protein [Gammaproteobacteria bacterium]